MLWPITALASPWDLHIHQVEKWQKLPRRLLSAILQFESNFRPQAVNPKKSGVAVTSYGLGQLTLDTAAAHCGLVLQDLYAPIMNITCSAKVLRYQLDRFSSNLDYAISAYNAGTPCVCDGSVYRYEGWHDGQACRKPRTHQPFACTPPQKGRFLNQPYIDGVKALM